MVVIFLLLPLLPLGEGQGMDEGEVSLTLALSSRSIPVGDEGEGTELNKKAAASTPQPETTGKI
jgi:hypothetical protein